MKKYEELKNNVYVKEVGNLSTLKQASKMLGISSKELRKYVVVEQMTTNELIKNMFNKLFGANIIPDIQQQYYLEILEKIPSLGYNVSVLIDTFPNLKNNPSLLFQAITDYNSEQVKQFDIIELQKNNKNVSPSLVYYVSGFASDYGISSKKMYNHIVSMQSKNKSIFDKMLNTIKNTNYTKQTPHENILQELKKIPNLNYVVASLIYNFPNIVSNTDSFLTAIMGTDNTEIEKVDCEEIDDKNLEKFIESKKTYFMVEKSK